MARFAFVTLACAVTGAVGALEVTMPSEGSVCVADRTTAGSGSPVQSVSLRRVWCPDLAGDYDVIMPEPMTGTSNTGYKIRVADVNDEESVDCSELFTLLPSEKTPIAGEVDGLVLVVTSPMDGDMAEACMEYTVEWDYDDGWFGSAAGRFHIDLFEADGSRDCETFYAALCDKKSICCKDNQGYYDSALPCDVKTVEYKIRVGAFDDDLHLAARIPLPSWVARRRRP